jgi:4-diphosphocytidyl-2-C-methyl-D-erythritol kinase
LQLELFTPDIGCDTAEVYKTFNQYLLRNVDLTSFFGWDKMDSRTLLKLIQDPIVLNDLFPAAMAVCPELEKVKKEGWFFSGSGSTFFRLKAQ